MERACFETVAKRVHQSIPSTPCTRLDYAWLEREDYPIWNKQGLQENHTVTYLLLRGSPKRVSVDEEYLIYDFVAMISAIGGTLGLCIGFSFFDFCGFILSHLELGIEKFKRDRKVVSNPVIREVRSSHEMINEKLKVISISIAKVGAKMSTLENNMETLQMKMIKLETR